MKNLKVVKCCDVDFDINIIGQCIDADKGKFYLLEKGFTLKRAEEKGAKLENIDVKIDINSLNLTNLDSYDIRLIEFMVESSSILIATKSGYLLRVGVSPFSAPSECIYQHNKAISSVSVSPDQDFIVLADDDNEILMMSIDGEKVTSENALLQNESLHKPVGVGWGSKETQFFGLDGRPSKETRDNDNLILTPKQLSAIEQIEHSDIFKKFRHNQERSTVVDWRGDGQYIATLTYLPDSEKHLLKVWNRNLELQYMSEQLVTIERGVISWIPNGQYICCTQRRNRRICDIVMFEKNGMIHQRISLPSSLDNVYIKNLVWSHDSKILAVIVNQYFANSSLEVYYKPILMLYTMQNFHYYLKYSTYLPERDEYLLHWNLNYNIIHILSSEGDYSELDCDFIIDHSNKLHNIAVVDGCKVLLTPFEVCRIPPPMSALEFDLECPIYRVTIDNNRPNNLYILTLDNRLLHIHQDKSIEAIGKSLKVQFINKKASLVMQNIILDEYPIENVHDIQHILATSDENSIIVVRSVGASSELAEWTLMRNSIIQSNMLMTIPDNQVFRHSNQGKFGQYLLLLSDRSIYLYEHSTNSLKPSIELTSTTAIQSQQTVLSLHIVDPEQSHLLTLSRELILKLHKGQSAEMIISNSCTSYKVTENYLIYITTDDLLHFIYMKKLLESPEGTIDSISQSIESGATLVTVSEVDCQVVIQMPRGNLEIIHPRLLILASVTAKLVKNEKFYRESFEIARRHRLDMNYIADFLMRKWYIDRKNCIKSLARELSPEQLCLFLTDINNCDTIKERYKDFLNHIPPNKYLANDFVREKLFDKTSKICIEFKRCLLEDEDHRGYNVAYLEVDLLLRLKMKNYIEAVHYIAEEMPERLQPLGLKFVLYYIDIEELFSAALKTYSIDNALMVANASNKDPKEYLILLDKFNKEFKIGYEHGRYAINLHLKDYEAAFCDLVDMCTSDQTLEPELIELVTSKKIFRCALGYVRLPSMLKGTIWSNYGDYLLVKRCYLEAGIAFFKALNLTENDEHFNSAFKCFMLANNWKVPLVMIAQSKVNNTLKNDALKKIIGKLNEGENILESLLLQQVCKFELDEEFKTSMIKARHWYILDFITSGSIRADICTFIESLSSKLKSQLVFSLRDTKDQFERLKYLLSTYQTRKQNFHKTDCFASDCLSTVDGSEVSSLSGSYGRDDSPSGASSIKTRKTSNKSSLKGVKKKRINTKKDTRYEDMALVLELKKFISELKIRQQEVVTFSVANFVFREDGPALECTKSLKNSVIESIQFAREMIELLWPSGPHCEQMYSLYRRFVDGVFPAESYENVDFEILIKPEDPNDLIVFELF